MEQAEVGFPSKSGMAKSASRVFILVSDGWAGISCYNTDFNRHF